VQTYYAGKEERPQLRQTLLETQRNATANGKGWEVVITTYNLSQGDERDRKFFRRVQWDVSPSRSFWCDILMYTHIDMRL
jgi:SWI/SNF-related matrix-associated actin-dependent regulator 1 of chromatin subfamily A